MTKSGQGSKETRLAAALRDNLRRRKNPAPFKVDAQSKQQNRDKPTPV